MAARLVWCHIDCSSAGGSLVLDFPATPRTGTQKDRLGKSNRKPAVEDLRRPSSLKRNERNKPSSLLNKVKSVCEL